MNQYVLAYLWLFSLLLFQQLIIMNGWQIVKSYDFDVLLQVFNKVIMVFSALCSEISELKHEVQDRIFLLISC